MKRLTFLLALTMATAVCGSSSDEDTESQHTVTIDLARQVDTIQASSEVMIGSDMHNDPRYQLANVYSGFFTESGTVVLANSSNRDIREFTVNGAFVRMFGREGSGPGEFRRPQWIAPMPGDSLLIYDGELTRFSVFTSDGDFSRSFSLPAAAAPFAQAVWFDATPEGEVLVGVSNGVPAQEMSPGGPPVRDSITVARIDGNGEMLETVSAIANRFWERLPSQVCCRTAVVDGGPFAVLGRSGNVVHQSSNDQPTIDLVNTNDELVTTWRFLGLQPVLPEEAHEIVGGVFFEQIVVTDAGSVWIAEATQSEDPTRRWHVIGMDGERRAVAVLPGNMRVLDVKEDLVLGSVFDEEVGEQIYVLTIG